jgi:hypothetical protein
MPYDVLGVDAEGADKLAVAHELGDGGGLLALPELVQVPHADGLVVRTRHYPVFIKLFAATNTPHTAIGLAVSNGGGGGGEKEPTCRQ